MTATNRRLSNVRHCARCGQDHTEMLFQRFSQNPIEDSDGIMWDWWGLCPVTNEPVLQRDIPDKTSEALRLMYQIVDAQAKRLGDG